jgi:AAA domain/Toprim domain
MSFPFSPAQVAAALGGKARGNSITAPGPGHSKGDKSLHITIDPSAPDGFLVHSFAGEAPLDLKDHVREKLGIGRWEPTKKSTNDSIIRMSERVKPKTPAAEYVYQLEGGTPYLRVKRTADKQFYQQHWNGSGWVNGAPQGPKIPYRLPELLAAEHDTILIVEGEKDVDALSSRGLLATTNAGGAEKWTEDLNRYFQGRDIYILPDNDAAGERHAKQVAKHLTTVAREIRIVRLPGLPEKGDVSDWLAAGGTADELARLMEATPKIEEGAEPRLIVSSAEFIAGFVPPDYLIDGLVQRRFVYSLTAPTGTGKTAVALLLCACVALGRPVGEYQLERGRVLYLAGENPDDVRMRWLAMADAMGFDIAAIDVHFLPGVFKLSEIAGRIRAEIDKIGPVALVVVDTSAAYFEGSEENANVEMGLHARRMRSLVNMPGGPCVVVACHPVKNADPNNLLPRGGGAFIAEMDGNLTLSKSDTVVTLHWQGKFRGPDFAPIPFLLSSATTEMLKDSKGRTIPTVIAKAMSERERSDAEANSRNDEDALLIAIADNDRASMASLATTLQWFTKDSKPYKARVQRSADRLKKGGYVKTERSSLALTEKGKKEAIRAKQNAELAGSRYG